MRKTFCTGRSLCGACRDAAALCFLQCYSPPRNLHSFPTRRSSDLCRVDSPRLQARQRAGRGRRARAGDRLRARSEEHTSELQSQFHLVCRLLLEKKKPRSFERTASVCSPSSGGGVRIAPAVSESLT